MPTATGKVFKVYPKTFSGKETYSIKLEDDPLYYRAGGKRWAGIAEPGNAVTFEFEPNEDGKSGRITSDVRKASPAQTQTAVNAVGPGREPSIHYQSARKDALSFIELAVSAGAITLPSAAKAKLGALEAMLDRYTALFFEDIATLGAVARQAEGQEGPVEVTPEGEE